jgi:hypothetical protein
MATYALDVSLTGQLLIESSRIEIVGTDTRNEAFFCINKLDLSDLGLQDDASVILEVRTGRYGYEAFMLGTVSRVNYAVRYPIKSEEIRRARVDIVVVSNRSTTKGDILAHLRNLKLSVNGKPPSFLQFDVRPLAEKFWDFDPRERTVTFNDRVSDASSRGNKIETMALILHKIVEDLVFWYLSDDSSDADDHYKEQVQHFIESLIMPPPDGNLTERERIMFARNVADEYAKRGHLVSRFNQQSEEPRS